MFENFLGYVSVNIKIFFFSWKSRQKLFLISYFLVCCVFNKPSLSSKNLAPRYEPHCFILHLNSSDKAQCLLKLNRRSKFTYKYFCLISQIKYLYHFNSFLATLHCWFFHSSLCPSCWEWNCNQFTGTSLQNSRVHNFLTHVCLYCLLIY